jgi:hypothetical protein
MVAIGAVALVAAGGAATAGASTPPEPAPDATATTPFAGHGQVVAQAAVALAGASHWTVTPTALAPNAPTPAAPASSFIAVITGAAIPTAEDGTALARVGAGEAAHVATGTSLVAADGAPAELLRLELAAGDGDSPSSTIGPPPGLYDVDLVRDILAPGESMPIPDSPAAPALVVAVSGSVTVAGAPSGSVDVADGQSATLDGSLTVVNAGTSPAVVLAGIIGSLVQATPQTDQPTTTTGPGGNDTNPQPTTPSAPDADNDGLSDEDEAAAQTDLQNPDSDGDGLTDGEEVHTYGTDPLSSRTDSDHLEDGLEIERGTNPLDPDTDDDGCQDSSDDNPLVGDGDCDGDTLSFDQERQLGTDPANPDTDGDGIDDDMDPQPLSAGGGGGGGGPEVTEAIAPDGTDA